MVLGIGMTSAQTEPAHPFEAQGYVGSYGPGPDEFDDQVVFGGSFGWRMSEGFVVEAGFGTTTFEGTFEDSRSRVDIDGNAVFLDAGAEWAWFPKSVVTPTLFGGMGWAFMSVDSSSEGPRVSVDVDDATGDSWTLYGGVGLRVKLGQDSPFFINGRWFYRWFDQRGSDSADRELTAAFGYQF
jgi:hypothetical protein